ncbi:hypothetical protein FRX31_018326 [Thalictrum thalictroides]|uniref:Uncharacterized protein n=1 Tax=Thalictrum thalictroides TaxID=46969 RepID=A0A7J6W562_THATH|nr:hypothetical protein FRX31_018326 [Thalictrum thalictroides]
MGGIGKSYLLQQVKHKPNLGSNKCNKLLSVPQDNSKSIKMKRNLLSFLLRRTEWGCGCEVGSNPLKLHKPMGGQKNLFFFNR